MSHALLRAILRRLDDVERHLRRPDQPYVRVGTLLNSSSVRWFGAGVATDAPIL